jgi:hypothetical protein
MQIRNLLRGGPSISSMKVRLPNAGDDISGLDNQLSLSLGVCDMMFLCMIHIRVIVYTKGIFNN